MPREVLTDAEVRELRTRRVINGEYLKDLCAEFGISVSHGSRIVRGEWRARAGGPLQEHEIRLAPRSGPRRRSSVLSEEDRELVRQMIRDGATLQAIADVMFVSLSTVKTISARMHRSADVQ